MYKFFTWFIKKTLGQLFGDDVMKSNTDKTFEAFLNIRMNKKVGGPLEFIKHLQLYMLYFKKGRWRVDRR